MGDLLIHCSEEHPQIRLVLLHGWGADASDLMPLGENKACYVSKVCVLFPLEQYFSVQTKYNNLSYLLATVIYL